ncbi:hypothetical protein [Salibacterium halotolerans]|uniref:Uncharacterized protein n=1 Tax=Salibacterium halotolerans TaxID=1884432 RepID=A0A1I5MJD6_9BACI|nr:hypothetical protein [Salibacterium halotolerans]SFP09603.1 hypothetical protein SAMN05518683_102255 [Salibacterium halotolerans]
MRIANKISAELLDYVQDGDLHTKMGSVPYSTEIRNIVTVGHMMERHTKNADRGNDQQEIKTKQICAIKNIS